MSDNKYGCFHFIFKAEAVRMWLHFSNLTDSVHLSRIFKFHFKTQAQGFLISHANEAVHLLASTKFLLREKGFAEAVRFELTTPCGVLVFKTSALDQLCDASEFYITSFWPFFQAWDKKNKNGPCGPLLINNLNFWFEQTKYILRFLLDNIEDIEDIQNCESVQD